MLVSGVLLILFAPVPQLSPKRSPEAIADDSLKNRITINWGRFNLTEKLIIGIHTRFNQTETVFGTNHTENTFGTNLAENVFGKNLPTTGGVPAVLRFCSSTELNRPPS